MAGTKGFFAVDMNMFRRMLGEPDIGADGVMAYLVLASHTSGRGSNPHQVSTAGALAVSKRLGIGRRAAERAICGLSDFRLISPIDALERKSGARSARYLISLSEEPEWVYIGHSLVRGVADFDSPLCRIYNEISIKGPITAKIARRDATALLVALYNNHSMLDFGGVSPHCLRTEWERTGEEIWLPPPDESDEDSIGGGFDRIRKSSAATAALSFVDCIAPGYEVDDSIKNRFWHAFGELCRLGFIYEVLGVWDCSPVNDDQAELLYTLYVFSEHARGHDPFLANVMNRVEAVARASGMTEDDICHTEIGEHLRSNRLSGEFWKTKVGHPLGVYRIRYRPNTRDVGEGFVIEGLRVDNWIKIVKEHAGEDW